MKRMAFAALLFAGAASAQITDFQTTPIDTPAAASQEAVDAFGNIWMVDPASNVLGRIDASLHYTVFAPPADEHALLYNLATTPDGSVWYADYGHPVVGRWKANGDFFRYAPAAAPYFIAGAADSGVFFSFLTNPAILGHLSTLGEYRQFNLPTGAVVENLTVGPDGAAYFTDLRANHRIVRIGPDGTVSTFADPAPNPPDSFTWFPGIAAGPDGNIWFSHATAIGRLRLRDGKVTEYTIPYAMADASGLTAGADGNVWFADSLAGAGVVSQLVVATATDDGHATINPSPGIGEPIGILAVAPLNPPAPEAGVRPATAPPSCGKATFVVEINIPAGPNLALATVTAPTTCADLSPDVIAFRLKSPRTVGLAIDVVNAGPDEADDVTLQITVHGLVLDVGGDVPGYDCETVIDTLYCDRTAPMPAGQTDSGGFELFLSEGAKSVSVAGTVYSSTPDPTPNNGFGAVAAAAPEPPEKVLPPPKPKAPPVSRKKSGAVAKTIPEGGGR